jgi:hypothetical protein
MVQIRKMMLIVDEVRSERGIRTDPFLRKVAVIAVFDNPFTDRYVQDLGQLTEASVGVAMEMSALAGSVIPSDQISSYGKGAIVGTAGEQEHGVAMLTTVFGNVMREFTNGGKAWISSATKRGGIGATIEIPLAHKDALYVRSHYDAMSVTLIDAPLPEEIAIISCYANRGRPNARVGGLDVSEIKGGDGLV